MHLNVHGRFYKKICFCELFFLVWVKKKIQYTPEQPEWRNGLSHCVTVLEVSLLTWVQSQLAVILESLWPI